MTRRKGSGDADGIAASAAAPAQPPGRQRASTIRDVAAAARVSTATVSKFLSGGQRFTNEVEVRIAEAVKQLGYTSNPMARGMITGRTGNVGIVILDIRNPHFGSLVKGASRIASGSQVNTLFADIAEKPEGELAALQSLSRRVDGLVLSARTQTPVVEWLHAAGIPMVFYGGPSPHPDYESISCDNHAAGFMLGRHLRELGHRSIGFIGFRSARWSDERLRGLKDAFARSRATIQTFFVASPSAEEGEKIASSVLLGATPLDAVVAFNDLIALGVMSEARRLGMSLPDHLSIAGFDNIVYGRYVSPSLTSVDMCSELLGEIAMAQLLALIGIGNPPPPTGFDAVQIRVMARESTARR